MERGTPMKLILLGAPGAGKGTNAEILSDKLNIPTISTGNILRAAVKDGTPMGLKAKSFMDAGALVPDEVILGIIKERLAASDCANGFILDGVPRTIAQAEALEQLGIEIDKVVNLLVEDSTIEARMAGRRVCAKCGASYHIKNKPSKVEGVCDRCGGELVIRKDDRPETVRDRLVTYHQQTEPLVDFYRKRGKLVDIHHGPVANLLPRGCETLREIRQRLRSNFRGKLRQPVQPFVIIAFVPQYLAEGRRGQALRLEKKSQIPGVPQEAAHLAPQPPYLLRAGRIVHAVVYLVRIFRKVEK